jgi:hypothetical protein
MPVSPISITVPAKITLSANSYGTFSVRNGGSQAIIVSDRVADINARSLVHPGAGYITISPQHFRLAPGKSRLIHIHANMPASVHGDHYANTVFTAAPAHHGRGTMHVTGAVASSVEIHAPATTMPGTHTGPATPSGFPLLWLAAGLLIVAALGLAFVLRTHRRGSGKHGLPKLT